jgi:SAM-dependent methyltransferase
MTGLEKAYSPEERKKIALQLATARHSERLNNADSYCIDRTGSEYLYRIGGLENLFQYIRGLSSKKVLHVGVGNGNASRVIGEMPIAKDFNFEVTALRNTEELRKNFSKSKIHITGVETLKGIPNESFAAVLGLNSLGYSDQPQIAVKRLNQVLVPGGVIKGTFCGLGEEEEHNGTVLKDPVAFANGLSVLGYDVAYLDNFFWSTTEHRFLNSILLAIKPGLRNTQSAKELLHLDFELIKSQAKDNLFGKPVFDISDS